jgi:hypothetical protein
MPKRYNTLMKRVSGNRSDKGSATLGVLSQAGHIEDERPR